MRIDERLASVAHRDDPPAATTVASHSARRATEGAAAMPDATIRTVMTTGVADHGV
jgi:hypothetical protein